MKSELSTEKIWFIASIAVLAFAYGAAVGKWEWFPHSILNRATDQARVVARSVWQNPRFLNPKVYDRSGVRAPRPEKVQSGLTLITSAWKHSGEWAPGLRLIDRSGEVLHEWRVNRDSLFKEGISQRNNPKRTGIHGSTLLPDGHVVVNLEYVGMARLDACSNVVATLTEGNHHSVSQVSEGEGFWVPGVHQERRIGSDRYPSGFPGLGKKKIWIDRVMKVSQDLKVKEDFELIDVIYKNDLERYFVKAIGGPWPEGISSADITHVNDIESLSPSLADEYPLFDAGDIMVSLRSLSLVFVFDPRSKKVKWHSHDPFMKQHDPDFLGEGWIGVFDNNYDFTSRGRMLGGSRIVGVQPHSDSTEVWFPTSSSEPFYTDVRGKWQMLANGNMLLTEATSGRVVEVDTAGRTVWEWVHKPTEDGKVPSVTKATRLDLTKSEISNWACSSVNSGRSAN